jgi:hypothetical protein
MNRNLMSGSFPLKCAKEKEEEGSKGRKEGKNKRTNEQVNK